VTLVLPWLGKEIDSRTDLYALGILLYELLTGKVPFSADHGLESLIHRHLHQPPPPLPSVIPVGIRLQVQQLLAKTPQERPSDALQVCRVLEAALSDEDVGDTVILGEEDLASAATEICSTTYKSENTKEAREKSTQGESSSPTRHLLRQGGIAVGGAVIFILMLFAFFFLRAESTQEKNRQRLLRQQSGKEDSKTPLVSMEK